MFSLSQMLLLCGRQESESRSQSFSYPCSSPLLLFPFLLSNASSFGVSLSFLCILSLSYFSPKIKTTSKALHMWELDFPAS